MEAYMKRDNQLAMEEVNKAIAEDSVFCEALVLKGDPLFRQPKHAALKRLKCIKKVIRINPLFS